MASPMSKTKFHDASLVFLVTQRDVNTQMLCLLPLTLMPFPSYYYVITVLYCATQFTLI